jgi:gluconolactonase
MPKFSPALLAVSFVPALAAADLPPNDAVKPVLLFEVPRYSEGVVFDRNGKGFISHEDKLTTFALDGNHSVWAVTGNPNGHKVSPDGTHLVCNNAPPAVLKLSADGKVIATVSKECDGKPLRGANDLSLDLANGGFYFTDPNESGKENPIGTVHYVDRDGTTRLVAGGLAYPNGIVLVPGGKRLLVGESQHNRILEFPVLAPGKVGEKRTFAELPTKTGSQVDNQPDGMCLDAAGNLYVAHYGMGQVQVLDPSGKLIRRYETGLILTSNVAFGGPNFDQLFVTGAVKADSTPGGVARLGLGVPGLRILPADK